MSFSFRPDVNLRFRFTSLIFLAVLCSVILRDSECQRSYFFEAKEKKPFNYYRIIDDPDQVKPDEITQDNLFAWLNLKNTVKFKLWTRDFGKKRVDMSIWNGMPLAYNHNVLKCDQCLRRYGVDKKGGQLGENPHLAHEIKYNNLESLRTSNFDKRRVSKFLIHGYADTANSVAVTYYLFHMRDAYLSMADVNVFIVDYSLFMIPIFYWTSNGTVAAARLGEFLQFMAKYAGLDLASVHLIGFSWGAHVAGIAGKAVLDKTGLKVGRITGLDPAGPTFHYLENEDRLDKSDADFVDIIHTNGGKRLLFGGHLGLPTPLAHVDVYPNGGQTQSGCPEKTPVIYETLECSHGRSARYFIESITSPLAFPLFCPCDNFEKYVRNECPCSKDDIKAMSFMGEHISHKTRGIFQIITKSHMPFGLGPQMNVVLPNVIPSHRNKIQSPKNVTKESPAEDSQSLSQLEDEKILISYKNVTHSVSLKNRYNTKEYPNDDVVHICQNILKNV